MRATSLLKSLRHRFPPLLAHSHSLVSSDAFSELGTLREPILKQSPWISPARSTEKTQALPPLPPALLHPPPQRNLPTPPRDSQRPAPGFLNASLIQQL